MGPPLRIMGSDKYIGRIILLKKNNNHMFVNFPTLILTHICFYFPFKSIDFGFYNAYFSEQKSFKQKIRFMEIVKVDNNNHAIMRTN